KPTKKLLQDEWMNGGKDAAGELVDNYVTSPIFKRILKDPLKGGIVSTIVVDTTQALTEPEELFTTEGQTKYTIDLASGIALVYFGLGPEVAIPVFIVKQYVFYEIDENKRCAYTATDDLVVVVNAEPGVWPEIECDTSLAPEDCNVNGLRVHFSCQPPREVGIFNYGDTLEDASITVTDLYDISTCKQILTEPEYFSESFELYSSEEEMSCFATLRRTDNSDFIDYALLRYGAVTIGGSKLCYHAPHLKTLTTKYPIIRETKYIGTGYPGDNVAVSLEIYDDQDSIRGDSTFINWTHNGIAHSADIIRGTYPSWEGDIPIPLNAADGDTINFQIQVTDTEYHKTVDDNDQRMYQIMVVEDTDFGGDVSDIKADAYWVSPSAFMRSGWLWPQPDEVFGSEEDWYKVYIEKGKHYVVDVNASKPIVVRLDKPNAATEKLTLFNQGSINFEYDSSGFLYLGFEPRRISDYGMNYSFRVTESGTKWVEPYSMSVDYYTPFKRYFTHVCSGTETYSCLGSQVMGVHDVLSYIEDFDGYDPNSLTPGDNLYFDIYEAEDCNGDEKEYVDVNVAFYPYTGYGGVTVRYIQPVINSEGDYDCDKTTINTFVSDYNTQYFTARVPIPEEDGVYYVEMRVDYQVSPTLLHATYTEPFAFNFDVRQAPTLNNFSTNIGYNSVVLTADVSDDEGLDTAEFYFDYDLICTKSLSGKHNSVSCTVDTSSLTDNTNYNAYIKVYDEESSYFKSGKIYPTVRNDLEKPIILSTYVLPTENGEAYNNNVSGTVMLTVSTYDTEGGANNIQWYRDGVGIGSGAALNWTTTSTSDGLHNIRVDISDLFGNTETQAFTVNVDNTQPAISDTVPEDGDILEGIVDLRVNVTDSGSALSEVEWYLGTTKIGSGTRTIWGSSGLDGDYTLTVNVTDLVGNTQSRDIYVTIISPDLSINESEFSVTDNNITAVVRNLGSANATDVNISFYAGNESFSSEIINLTAGESQTLFVEYNTTGKDIIVVADPYDWITEVSERNNYVIRKYTPCPSGGFIGCNMTYCCGAVDGVCPLDFDWVECGVSDPDCPVVCTEGGFSACGVDYCCGVVDGICPEDFDGVNCTANDPDCVQGCANGGFSACGVDYCCGASDGICPTDFDNVDCSVWDPDCSPGGISTCQGVYLCGEIDGICPEDFDDVSCSTFDVDCV
ncbi:MAG: hypothetical protein JW778_03770, partial [Candidatus Altiarchaeota archaeon]|nr:hypothetical protein [Candidatus Altiarchaeota archaeon]